MIGHSELSVESHPHANRQIGGKISVAEGTASAAFQFDFEQFVLFRDRPRDRNARVSKGEMSWQ